jgi:voltage-gated potassium channel
MFLTEYLLRLITVTESNKYGEMGTVWGRLSWMMTTPALIDLLSTLPYFVEKFTSVNLPTLTYLRSARLLRLNKTARFSEAIQSVCRVFYYNKEILSVSAMIGVGLVLFTAVLMYYLRPRDGEHPEFKSIPRTLYLSTLMLTGQGGPDGPDLPWYTSAVVLLTGVFSIGMFAIPASMLTWGFEAEAQRYAILARKREEKNVQYASAAAGDEAAQAMINQENADEIEHDNWSYSSNGKFPHSFSFLSR